MVVTGFFCAVSAAADGATALWLTAMGSLAVAMWLVLVSMVVVWLRQVSQRHAMYCHDLEFMDSNPGQVEPGVFSTSD